MKKSTGKIIACSLAMTMILSGCGENQEQGQGENGKVDKETVQNAEYQRYQVQILGAFDTVIQIMGYTQTQEEFEVYAGMAKERFTELNQLFDRFTLYEGMNNVKTINDNAGIAPVVVDPVMIDLIEFSIDWYHTTDGKVNIAMGPVLDIWHDYMGEYSAQPEDAKLPPMEDLQQGATFANIEDIIIDKEASTIFLKEKGMMIDVGATAKGYATEIVTEELFKAGLESLLVSAGGNVVAKNPPIDDTRDSWNIGIQNPSVDLNDPQSGSVNIVSLNQTAVVTSGDYVRYYMVEDKRIHHLIDPETLMPADHYRSVTVVTEDSGDADALSTALYCMDYETSQAFAQEHGLAVMWIMQDGSIAYTDEIKGFLSRPDIAHTDEFMKLYQ